MSFVQEDSHHGPRLLEWIHPDGRRGGWWNQMMRHLIVLALLSTSFGPRHLAAQADTAVIRVNSPAVTGDLRLHPFTSTIYGNRRMLRVLLPEGYGARANQSKRYPILYLADGQNLFDPSTSVFAPREWHVDEIVKQLVDEGKIPPMIIVGVDDAGRTARAHEYLAYPDPAAESSPDFDAHPEGKRYPDFMINEVMPFINAR
ncbi:MAG: alpha/beta hydrolase-fold protein, partial [Gemmatimonadota bacterium]